MGHTDQESIDECLNGRPAEFRHLVARYEKPIMAYLVGRLGDREAAEEAAQEAFVRAFFRLDRLKKPSAFFPWLTGIAQRVMLETFRQRRRTESFSEANEPRSPASNGGFENDGELAAAVARLPEAYREAIILRYFGDLSCAEVGERLGVPLGTVTKRLSRGYALLREAFEARGLAPRKARP